MLTDIIIRKPIITEKTLADAVKNIYTFEVDLKADKRGIKQKVEELFNVHVQKVNTSILKGKNRRVGKKRIEVKKTDRKKARVQIRSGEKIELFEVGQGK